MLCCARCVQKIRSVLQGQVKTLNLSICKETEAEFDCCSAKFELNLFARYFHSCCRRHDRSSGARCAQCWGCWSEISLLCCFVGLGIEGSSKHFRGNSLNRRPPLFIFYEKARNFRGHVPNPPIRIPRLNFSSKFCGTANAGGANRHSRRFGHPPIQDH